MSWKELELMFNRAFSFSFSKKKFLFVFPILMCLGLLIVLCRALAIGGAGDWVKVSLAFLPLFLSAGVLLALGIVLVRLYHHEVKGLRYNLFDTVRGSWDLMAGIAYLAVPFVMAYLVLWTLLGIFYLAKAILPGLGIALFFGPFLLVLGSMVLSIINLLMLFYLTPAVALKSRIEKSLSVELWQQCKDNSFRMILLFAIGIFPLLGIGSLLALAAIITEAAYLHPEKTFAVALEWFFIMVPFVAILSPFIIFFFNFAAEGYIWMKK